MKQETKDYIDSVFSQGMNEETMTSIFNIIYNARVAMNDKTIRYCLDKLDVWYRKDSHH
jgi:hypothetical protein